jgi:hypothetical protein
MAQSSKFSSPKQSSPKQNVAYHPACRTNFKATKAWAFIFHDHLGRKEPRTSLTVHLRSTAMRDLRSNKTARRVDRFPENPSSFISPSLPRSRERESWRGVASRSKVQRRPLAGVRCSPEGERAAVEPARGSALRWRSEPTHRRPDKRRRMCGSGPSYC